MDNSFLHSKRLLLVDDEQELLKMGNTIQRKKVHRKEVSLARC